MGRDLPDGIILSEPPERFRAVLLDWFDGNKRQLPWRRQRTLYGTWISEMMLQQTTVRTVVPYWERFLAVFPDVRALAAADVEEVLSLWTGLGYYRRARQLHEAARIIVSDLGGEFPDDEAGWLALPGIGPYASGAVASIGLGRCVPAVDANARRVFSRWLVGDPGALPDLEAAHLDRIARLLVDPDRPGDWNEAVMELGATVCRAAGPDCAGCPVGALCRAHLAGIVDQVPPAKAPARTVGVLLGLLVVRWRDRVLLLPPGAGPAVVPPGSPAPARKDLSGIHEDLWGLPSTPWLPRPVEKLPGGHGDYWRPWLEGIPQLEYSPRDGGPELLGTFRHAITRYRLEVEVHGVRLDDGLQLDGKTLELPDPEEPLPGFNPPDPEAAGQAPGAVFATIPSRIRPVSNLVAKSLRLADHSSG